MPEATKQEEFSKSLRALADWYEQHPEVPVPELRLSVLIEPEQFAVIPAETREDIYISPSGGGLYRRYLERDGYSVQFYTGLEQMAEKKVTGQKVQDVFEWVIKPQFAGTETPQETP